MDWRIQPTDPCPCISTLMCHSHQGIHPLKWYYWPSIKSMALVSPCCSENISGKRGDYVSLVQALNSVSRKHNEVFGNNRRQPWDDRVCVCRGSFLVWNRCVVSLRLFCSAQSLWNRNTGASEEHGSSISSLEWVVSMQLNLATAKELRFGLDGHSL